MTIEIKKVCSKAELKTFISLPQELYKGFTEYVPPLDLEIRGILDPDTAPFFKYGEAVYWIAYKNGAPVGRISAQIDRAQPSSAYGNAGLFGCLDVIDDIDVTCALMEVAETWLREKGYERAVGPFILNINGMPGILVEGYDLEPLTMVQWHPPYLKEHFEKMSFQPVRDLHFWRLQWTPEFEEAHHAQRKLPDLPTDISFRKLNFKDLATDIEIIRRLFNNAWRDNWGFVPLHAADTETLSKELKPIMKPEMGLIVEKKGKPVAAMLVVPNLFEITHDLGAKPSPLGWLKLAWRTFRHQYRSGRVLMFGISDEIRHSVGGAVIAIWTVQKLISVLLNMNHDAGWVEAGWVLDNNKPLQAILEKQGFHKTRTLRLFDREISSETNVA